MPLTPARLLLLDDTKWFGEAFQYCLADTADIVYLGWFSINDAGFAACRRLLPDIVLLDIDPGKPCQLAMIDQLLNLKRGIKVVGFSMAAPANVIPLLVEHGAAGFISKYASLETIIREIKRVNTGGWFRQG